MSLHNIGSTVGFVSRAARAVRDSGRAWMKTSRTPSPAMFEPLESRIVLATIVWDGGGNGRNMTQPENWEGDVLPGPADIAVIDSAGPDIELFDTATLSVGALRIEPPQGGTRRVQINGTLGLQGFGNTVIGPGGLLIVGTGVIGHPARIEGVGTIATRPAFQANDAGALLLRGGTITSGITGSSIVNEGLFSGFGTLGWNLFNEPGGLAEFASITLDAATIENDFSGTMRFNNTTTLSRTGQTELIRNRGMAERVGGSTGYTIAVPFINESTGRVVVHATILQIRAPFSTNSQDGIMEARPGATLRLGDTSATAGSFLHEAGSRLIADGTIELFGPHDILTDVVTPTQWTGAGRITFLGAGVKHFANEFTIETADVRFAMSAQGTTGALLNIPRNFEWASGAGAIGNPVRVTSTGRMMWTGNTHVLTSTLVNESLDPLSGYDMPGGFISLRFDDGRFENNGLFTIDIDSSSPVTTSTLSTGSNRIVNNGEMTITSALGGSLRLRPDFTFDNPGILNVESGGLEVQGTIAQVLSGRLTGGDWRITGPAFINAPQKVTKVGSGAKVTFSNNADASLFLAANQNVETEQDSEFALLQNLAGTTGSFTHSGLMVVSHGSKYSINSGVFNPGSQTFIEIGGTSLSQPHVAGVTAMLLDGSLDVSTAPGFQPSLGQTFDIFTAGSRQGQFDEVELPDLSHLGLRAVLEYSPTTVTIRIGEAPTTTTIRWVGLGDGTSWFDTFNWDLNRTPQQGDDVIIPDVGQTSEVLYDGTQGSISINRLASDEPIRLVGGNFSITGNATSTTHSLTLQGTAIRIDADLTVLVTFDVEGGAIFGPGGIIILGLVSIRGGTTTLNETFWTIDGGLTWHAGEITSRDVTITLTAGTQWNNTTNSSVSLNANQGFTILDINGDMSHSGAGSTHFQGAGLQVTQHSTSTIDIAAGELGFLAGGAFAGDLTGNTPGRMVIAEDATLMPQSRMIGTWTYHHNAGTIRMQGNMNDYSGAMRIAAGSNFFLERDNVIDSDIDLVGTFSVGFGATASFLGTFIGAGIWIIEDDADVTYENGQTINQDMEISGRVAAPNGLTLGGAVTFNPNARLTSPTDIEFADTANVNLGEADIIIGGDLTNRGDVAIAGGTITTRNFTNTLSGSMAVNGGGVIHNGAGTNFGQITGQTFSVEGVGDFDNFGTFTLTSDSTLRTDGAFFNRGGAVFNLGPGSDIEARGGAENDGTMTLESSTATFGLVGQAGFTNRGEFRMFGPNSVLLINGNAGNDSLMEVRDTPISITADYLGVAGSDLILGGNNSRIDNVRDIILTDNARVLLESDVSFVQVDNDILLGPNTSIEIQIADLNNHPQINISNEAHLAGTLDVSYVLGFEPERPPGEGVRLRLIEADTLNGDFDNVILPTPPAGDKSVYIRGSNFVEILSTNIADFDDDGFLTIFDFLLFGNLWSIGDPRADLDQSTGVAVFDIFDFIEFGNLFSRG